MNSKDITDIAYLAGIIDGEGSIYIGNYSSSSIGTPYYQTNMEVSNTSEILIDWLCEKVGGRKSKYTPKQLPKNSRKPVFRWILHGEDLTKTCKLIYPYLVIKKRECEIMLEMRNTFDKPTNEKGHQGFKKVSQEILDKRKACFDEMRSLHCRNYKKL